MEIDDKCIGFIPCIRGKKLFMDLELKDKIIIVTGGAKGIGEGIVKLLANEGAIPVIVGRNEEDNLETVKEIEKSGGKAFQVSCRINKTRRM